MDNRIVCGGGGAKGIQQSGITIGDSEAVPGEWTFGWTKINGRLFASMETVRVYECEDLPEPLIVPRPQEGS